MSFEKGNMNVSVVEFDNGIDKEKFMDNIVSESYSNSRPSIEEPVCDFTSGISLAPLEDGDEPEQQDFELGGLPYFAVRVKELKIDSGRLKELVERKVFDLIRETGSVSSKQKKAIKESLIDALSVDAVEKVSGIRCVIAPDGKRMFVDATSERKVDDVVIEQIITSIETGAYGNSSCVGRMSPYRMYAEIKGAEEEYIPFDMNNFACTNDIGNDFLTYLYMASEVEDFFDDVKLSFSGNIEFEDCRECSSGSKVTSLKDGTPSICDEALSAMLSGKKVRSAEISISFGGDAYKATVDKELFFKKLSIENEEKDLDIHSMFESRIRSVNLFVDGIKKVFRKFVESEDNNENLVLAWLKTKQNIMQPS